MPENDAHIPGMNAVSFVAYCGELAGLPRVDAMQRAHEVLFYVGLGEARYRNVETYSTGMKQRIKLAQALVHDPDLLFLDEPTNGMDPKGRDEMLELVRDLAHNKGVNVIVSSHLLPDVEYTCDHVVVMDKGRVATQGPIAALKQPRGRVFELRVKSAARRRRISSQTLRAGGLECHATDDDVMRVFVPGEGGAREIFALAAAAGRPGAASASERPDARGRVRAGGRGSGSRRCRFMIRAIGATGASASPHGRAWAVIATAGIRTLLREARVHRPAAAVVDPVPRARRADLRGGQPAAGGVSRADARDVPRVPRPAGSLRVLHHRLCRPGLIAERSARQRAADLSVQAADAR